MVRALNTCICEVALNCTLEPSEISPQNDIPSKLIYLFKTFVEWYKTWNGSWKNWLKTYFFILPQAEIETK